VEQKGTIFLLLQRGRDGCDRLDLLRVGFEGWSDQGGLEGFPCSIWNAKLWWQSVENFDHTSTRQGFDRAIADVAALDQSSERNRVILLAQVIEYFLSWLAGGSRGLFCDLFRGETNPPNCSYLAVPNRFRYRALDHLTNSTEVVIRGPVQQFQQIGFDRRRIRNDAIEVAQLGMGRVIGDFDDPADAFGRPEGHPHLDSGAHLVHQRGRNPVIEGLPAGYRECYTGYAGH
jgi:hypothetical protein